MEKKKGFGLPAYLFLVGTVCAAGSVSAYYGRHSALVVSLLLMFAGMFWVPALWLVLKKPSTNTGEAEPGWFQKAWNGFQSWAIKDVERDALVDTDSGTVGRAIFLVILLAVNVGAIILFGFIAKWVWPMSAFGSSVAVVVNLFFFACMLVFIQVWRRNFVEYGRKHPQVKTVFSGIYDLFARGALLIWSGFVWLWQKTMWLITLKWLPEKKEDIMNVNVGRTRWGSLWFITTTVLAAITAGFLWVYRINLQLSQEQAVGATVYIAVVLCFAAFVFVKGFKKLWCPAEPHEIAATKSACQACNREGISFEIKSEDIVKLHSEATFLDLKNFRDGALEQELKLKKQLHSASSAREWEIFLQFLQKLIVFEGYERGGRALISLLMLMILGVCAAGVYLSGVTGVSLSSRALSALSSVVLAGLLPFLVYWFPRKSLPTVGEGTLFADVDFTQEITFDNPTPEAYPEQEQLAVGYEQQTQENLPTAQGSLALKWTAWGVGVIAVAVIALLVVLNWTSVQGFFSNGFAKAKTIKWLNYKIELVYLGFFIVVVVITAVVRAFFAVAARKRFEERPSYAKSLGVIDQMLKQSGKKIDGLLESSMKGFSFALVRVLGWLAFLEYAWVFAAIYVAGFLGYRLYQRSWEAHAYFQKLFGVHWAKYVFAASALVLVVVLLRRIAQRWLSEKLYPVLVEKYLSIRQLRVNASTPDKVRPESWRAAYQSKKDSNPALRAHAMEWKVDEWFVDDMTEDQWMGLFDQIPENLKVYVLPLPPEKPATASWWTSVAPLLSSVAVMVTMLGFFYYPTVSSWYNKPKENSAAIMLASQDDSAEVSRLKTALATEKRHRRTTYNAWQRADKKLKELRNSLSASKKQIDQLKSQIKALQEQADKKPVASAASSQQLQKLQRAQETLQKYARKKKAELEKLSSAHNKLQRKLSRLTKRAEGAENALAKLRKKLSSKHRRLVERLRSGHRKKVQGLQEQLRKSTTALAKLRQKRDALRKRSRQLAASVKKLSGQVQVLREAKRRSGNLGELRLKLAVAKKKAAKAAKKVSKLNAKVARLEVDKEDLGQQLSVAQSKLKQTKQVLVKFFRKYGKKRTSRKPLPLLIQDGTQHLAGVIGRLKKRAESAETSVARLQREKQQLTAQLKKKASPISPAARPSVARRPVAIAKAPSKRLVVRKKKRRRVRRKKRYDAMSGW